MGGLAATAFWRLGRHLLLRREAENGILVVDLGRLVGRCI